MESILVLTHCDETGTALSKGSLEAIAVGTELTAQLNSTLTIGIVCCDAAELGGSLPAAGARWVAVCGDSFAQPRYASDAQACEAICRAVAPKRFSQARTGFVRCAPFQDG